VTGAALPAAQAKILGLSAQKASGKRTCNVLILPIADLGAFLPDCESHGTAPLATVLAYGDETPTLSRAGRLGIAHHAPERLPMALERISSLGRVGPRPCPRPGPVAGSRIFRSGTRQSIQSTRRRPAPECGLLPLGAGGRSHLQRPETRPGRVRRGRRRPSLSNRLLTERHSGCGNDHRRRKWRCDRRNHGRLRPTDRRVSGS
jgi:hypothetical protein